MQTDSPAVSIELWTAGCSRVSKLAELRIVSFLSKIRKEWPINKCRHTSFITFCLTITLLIPSAIILALYGCTDGGDDPPAPYANTVAQMTASIESAMAQTNVTGLSIALVDGQNVVWSRGFGYADKEANIPATADTIYEIGSLSKTFAATAVMRLVEEGRMDIDLPLSTYLSAARASGW